MASSSTPVTPLLYSCIAHHNTILTEHTTAGATNTSSLASIILPKISHDSPQKLTYTHDQNLIHYIADASPSSSNPDNLSAAGLTYLVVAKADLGRRIPFGYLVEIKKRFLKQYDPERTKFADLPAYGAAAFNGQLKGLMVEYGTTKAGQDDAFANVQSEIDNVRGIMTENIERVLERGERIDLLVDKTDRLGGSARDFRVRSRGLRRKMWWKNMRLMVLMVVVIIFLVYLLVGFGCGLPGKSCALRLYNSLVDDFCSMGTMSPPMIISPRLRSYCTTYLVFERQPHHEHILSTPYALSPHPNASSNLCCAVLPSPNNPLSFTSSTIPLISSSPASALFSNSDILLRNHSTSPPASGYANPNSIPKIKSPRMIILWRLVSPSAVSSALLTLGKPGPTILPQALWI